MGRMIRTVATPLLLLVTAACGAPSETGGPAPTPPPPAADDNVLLDQRGRLESGDLAIGSGLADHYEVVVRAGDRITVQATSGAFDPLLEVTPPNGTRLVNDDWQGDRQRSRVDFVAEVDGTVKVRVTSFTQGASGDYLVRIERIPPAQGPSTVATAAQAVAMLAPGQQMSGTLTQGDALLADGAFYDQLAVEVAPGQSLELAITPSGGPPPRVDVVDPAGRALAAVRAGAFSLSQPGMHRVLVAAPAAGAQLQYAAALRGTAPTTPQLARAHHQLPGPLAGTPVTMGQHVRGRLRPNDPRLPTGETVHLYTLNAAANATLAVEMVSEDVDSYVLVVGPDGRFWEDDDGGGGRNASLEVVLPVAGEYRIAATTYRPSEHGSYELKVMRDRRASVATAPPPAGAQPSHAQRQTGSLGAGDGQLQSGELFDRYTYDFTAGQSVTLRASSTELDTYLIVRTPSGRQEDNDDVQPGNTNSQIDLHVTESGTHQVMVTSYRPGETGSYVLEVSGAAGGGTIATPTATPTPAPVSAPAGVTPRELRGSLAQGDATLSSGELSDRHALQLSPGRPATLRLRSSAFDPYLIVQTPSGQQIDNDDYTPGDLTAGIDIPSAEAGDYNVIVTSYQPGETGAWVLSLDGTANAPTPPVATPVGPGPAPRPGPAAPGGGRVFGVFAGITDYPQGVGDLDECANDAIKLAQALRERGLSTPDQQVVLTDGQATTSAIRGAMRTMSQRVGPNDLFVFFYSGHGGRAEGRPTRDTREIDNADEYLVMHDGELLDDELGSMFDGIQARMAVVALDACFAGGFAKDVITRPGRVGLFSSEEDVTSAVAGAFQAGGYLSHFLRLGVSGEADASPRDSVLTVGELTHYLTLQFGSHVRDVRTSEGFQHLVVDRGAVRSTDVMWAYR